MLGTILGTASPEISFLLGGPLSCPEKGPIGEYVMQPGTYDVVVKAADSASVTPFRGTWELGPGDEYYSCFYLVTR